MMSYCCPKEITSSRLLPTAVPAVFSYYCPKSSGSAPSKRKNLNPNKIAIKKPKKDLEPQTSDCVKFMGLQPATIAQFSKHTGELKKFENEIDNLKKQLDHVTEQLNEALKEMKDLKRENYLVNKKFKRLKMKNIDVELSARKYITKHNEEFLNNILSQLPDVPTHLHAQLPKLPKNLYPLLLLKTNTNE